MIGVVSTPVEHVVDYCGIDEHGSRLTPEEFGERQMLDFVRFDQYLAEIGIPLMQNVSAENRHAFENLLAQTVVTPHGDPSEEWQKYNLHRDKQKEIISALFHNPIGIPTLLLFRDHMAPILGDGTREVGIPVERLEFELESYFEDFVKILAELSDEAVHEHKSSVLLDVAGTLETHKKMLNIASETRSLVGSLCPETDSNQRYMDYVLTSREFYHHREPTRQSVV